MHTFIDLESCFGCFACSNICPNYAIEMHYDNEGFIFPRIDVTKCKDCNLCLEVCPSKNGPKIPDKTETRAYAAVNLNLQDRIASSSGGAFVAIAKEILKNSGVVFGAGFNNKLEVNCVKVKGEEELGSILRSKYLQNWLGESFKEIKNTLLVNQTVLFCGLPCQVAALRNFVQMTRISAKTLFTVDLICHGVPSSAFFAKYRSWLEKKYSSKMISINFRSKKKGWKKFSVDALFENGKFYSRVYLEDPFMVGYLKNYPLRESCYRCKFASLERVGDLSLGDFWGVEHVVSKLDDDLGVSLLFANTKKGEFLLNKTKDKLQIFEVNLDDASKYNGALIHPAIRPKERTGFFNDLISKDFEENNKIYLHENLVKKILCRIQNSFKVIK